MHEFVGHRRLRRAVDAYLDGELPPSAQAAVAHHLAICWECSTIAETLRLVKRVLRRRRLPSGVSLSEQRLRRFAEQLATWTDVNGSEH